METCTKCNGKNITIEKHYQFHNIYNCQDCPNWTYGFTKECCRDPFKIIVIDRKDHFLYFIREQCTHCGGCLNKSKPLSSKKYLSEIRGEFCQHREKEWKDNQQNEGYILSNLKKEHNHFNSPWYKYNQYLSSNIWKEKRKLIFDRDNNICQICKTEPSSEVHHLTYQNVYNEPLEDLIAICSPCHRKKHDKPTLNELNQGCSEEGKSQVG
jgi:5-methylcytosine-specific restriction endonuclease McrA